MEIYVHPLARQQFGTEVIGTKVRGRVHDFLQQVVVPVIKAGRCQAPTNAIPMKESDVKNWLSPGEGRRTLNQDDYVSRLWRGRIEQFLRRDVGNAQFEEGGDQLSGKLIIYTRSGYLQDLLKAFDRKREQGMVDEVSLLAEMHEAIAEVGNASHCLITVRADVAAIATTDYRRFVKNLAGENISYYPETFATKLIECIPRPYSTRLSECQDRKAVREAFRVGVEAGVNALAQQAFDSIPYNEEWIALAD